MIEPSEKSPPFTYGNARQLLVHVLVAPLVGRVDCLEQVDEPPAQLARVAAAEVAERRARLQQVGVLGVEQEDDAGDEHVERALLLARRLVVAIDVVVLLGEGVVEPRHVLTSLDRQLLLSMESARLVRREEGEHVKLVRQLVEGELLHPVLRALVVEVVEPERLEVARHEPARALRVRQVLRVPHCLLVRRLHTAVARLRLVEVNADGLLLAEEVMVGDEHVDAAAAHLALEVHERRHGG